MSFRIILFFILALYFGKLKAQVPASDILEESVIKANEQNKNIFLIYSASWCAWCKKMDENMMSEKCKVLFESNYVISHLDVLETERKKHLENPGAYELLCTHKGEEAGLPFWVILNREGILIEDSFDPEGENMGCPVTDEEVENFISILRNTSKLSEDELRTIAVTFYSGG